MHFNKSCFSSPLLLAAGSCPCRGSGSVFTLGPEVSLGLQNFSLAGPCFSVHCPLLAPGSLTHSRLHSRPLLTMSLPVSPPFPTRWLICQDELPSLCSLWLYPQPTAIVPPHPTGIFLALSSQLYLSAQLTALTTALC